ncbi:DUF5694 domain-containing protein [Fulvivirga maritima]|uniref:DUF5694 domain-containing protein n=1 Tax=Fulvivirga maritima TaxID=2904247 RepID=UPI001F216298|nr:DUF5694 domain-containing protein [Fulvivirga maritima]UII24449.1 DUF5694 domain-containing protein [Fulvivirga maritima]
MKIFVLVFLYVAASLLTISNSHGQSSTKTQIMFIGFDHLNQIYNGTEASDVLSDKNQKEIIRLAEALKSYAPDMIGIEVDPKKQAHEDSLYQTYLSGKSQLKDFEYGRGEAFQIGYRLGKWLNHDRIYAIDNDNSTSQGLLQNGDNIEIFKNQLKELQQTARPMRQGMLAGDMSLYDYIKTMNQPQFIDLTHHLIFNIPAYVVNGSFAEGMVNTVDLGKVDNKYIGAEYITLFYNRNLKIYSNILNAQLNNNKEKILIVIGQAHVGALIDLFEDNPNYEIISPLNYLK